ncbi:MAG: hypothetical protein JWN86_4409 [Planctomycetota bacterium]|nr:hypothetical protein [Planctomycetota bacterium]
MRHGTAPLRRALWAIFFCLFSTFILAADDAPLPDSRLGYRTAPLLLLSRPDVRADLGLSAQQTTSSQLAIRQMYVQAATLKKKPNTDETVRARRAIDEAMKDWLDTQLSPEQRARLVQIDLQWEGPSALVTRPIVAEALNLSKEQIALIESAVSRRDASRRKGHADAERVLGESSLATLSPAQRESWKQLLGKAFSPQTLTQTEPKKLR